MKVIFVPHYINLELREIIDFGLERNELMEYFPLTKELTKMSRKYICDVIYSIVGDEFEEWVNARVNLRHEKMAEKKDLMLSLDPEIARCYEASQALSRKFLDFKFCHFEINHQFSILCFRK